MAPAPSERKLFQEELNKLKKKLVSFHDIKVRKEELINEEYLEYLALKYTSKSFTDICINCDVEAIRKIISQI